MSRDGNAPLLKSGWPAGRSEFWNELPSWLVSLSLHALLLILISSNLRSCGSGMPGNPEGDFREVGIYLKSDEAEAVPEESPESAEETSESTFSSDATAPAESNQVEETPPAPVVTPSVETPSIGPGSTAPSEVPEEMSELTRPSGIARPSQAAALGLDETEFFGIRAKGTRFIYVLDSSGSMAGHNAIGVAKAELMASLAELEKTQQFQIIFYNQNAYTMELRGSRQGELYWANDVNRTLARQFIGSVQPDGGTEHLPALKRALSLDPDVLFLLTDAEQPVLTPGELNEIKRRNGGRTTIHCIEFGKGPRLSGEAPSFLQKLAQQNGGNYRYRDVKQFGRR